MKFEDNSFALEKIAAAWELHGATVLLGAGPQAWLAFQATVRSFRNPARCASQAVPNDIAYTLRMQMEAFEPGDCASGSQMGKIKMGEGRFPTSLITLAYINTLIYKTNIYI